MHAQTTVGAYTSTLGMRARAINDESSQTMLRGHGLACFVRSWHAHEPYGVSRVCRACAGRDCVGTASRLLDLRAPVRVLVSARGAARH